MVNSINLGFFPVFSKVFINIHEYANKKFCITTVASHKVDSVWY